MGPVIHSLHLGVLYAMCILKAVELIEMPVLIALLLADITARTFTKQLLCCPPLQWTLWRDAYTAPMQVGYDRV